MAVVINGTSGITGNTGTLISATTIGVGGATPSASGAGITFPATQNASSDANTLDDYEEGTFTPALSATGYTFTYTEQWGSYTKIGNLVTFKVYINPTFSTGSGTVQGIITGLPFTSSSYRTNYGGVSIFPDNGSQFFSRTGAVRTNPSSTTLLIGNGFGGSTIQTTFNWASMPASLEFELTGHYYV